MQSSLPEKKALPFVVCVEGNIGSGKSTLLSGLESAGYTVIPEPVTNIWGQYLPRLYEDINRWGFCFQMEVIDWFRQLQSKQFKVHLKKEIQQSMLTPQLLRNLRCTSPEIEQIKIEKQRRLIRTRNEQFNLPPRKRFKANPKSENGGVASKQPFKTPKRKLVTEEKERELLLDGRTPLAAITPKRQVRFKNQNLFPTGSGENGGDSLPSQVNTRTMIIVERSALSAIEVFGRNLLANGHMSEWEFSLLQRFYSIINWQPSYILYLRCDAATCCERIRQRNRDGENKVNFELVDSLHRKHEELFIRKKRDELRNQTVITVDGTKDSTEVAQQALIEISKLEQHLHAKHRSSSHSPINLIEVANGLPTEV